MIRIRRDAQRSEMSPGPALLAEKDCPPSPALLRWGVSVHFTILGSGSGGNCAYLETDEVRLLIDAGLSGRQIRQLALHTLDG